MRTLVNPGDADELGSFHLWLDERPRGIAALWKALALPPDDGTHRRALEVANVGRSPSSA